MATDGTAAPTFETILYSVEDGIATITLNRPEKLNALGWDMLEELGTALKLAERTPEARVVIIKGAGRCFSAGYELDAGGLTGPRGNDAYGRSIWNSRAHVQGHIDLWLDCIWRLWKPVIAQVHSYCLAGGSELALICDLTIVSTDARIGYPPVRFMATGDMFAVYAWLAGMKKAKELAFGGVMSGEEAVTYGLANHVFEPDKLEQETRAIARRIASIDPELLSLSKAAVNRTFDVMGFRTSMEYGGEFDSLSHFGRASAAYKKLVAEKGLGAALKEVNRPFGGV